MRHRRTAAPRSGLSRAWAGAALAFALLGVGSVSYVAQDEGGTPIVFAPGAHVEPPAPTGPLVAPMPESQPVNIQIPALDVTSPVMNLGLRADGAMEVPPGAYPAGWYDESPTPGELGPAIIAAHVDWNGEPGVFFQLHELEPGDEVVVARRGGSTAIFRVDRIDEYAKDSFPTEAVYGDIDHAGLRLITCGGEFDDDARSYVNNIVVYASLTRSSQT